MQHVQYARRGTNVQMVHHLGCVLKATLHPSVPRHARLVLLVIDALVQECLPLRAVPKDSTQTRPHKWDVTLVKLEGNAQMEIDLFHAQLVILVNMESPTAHPVSQDITVLMVHLCVCHVLLENNVWTLVLSQWIVLMGLFLAQERVFVSCVHKVSSWSCFTYKHTASFYTCRNPKEHSKQNMVEMFIYEGVP